MRIRPADSGNGAVAVGDCAAVQYSGAGGRDPLFLAENLSVPQRSYQTAAGGRDVDTFLPNARFFDKCASTVICCIPPSATVFPRRCSTPALASGRLKAEVVCDEWQLPSYRKRFRYLVRAATTATSPWTK